MRVLGSIFIALAAFTAALSAAKDTQSNSETPSKLLLPSKYEVNSIAAVQEGGYWLASSEEKGLLKFSSSKNVKTLLPGSYEHIDSLRVNEEDFIVSYDTDIKSAFILFEEKKHSLSKLGFNLDGVCLYSSPEKDVFAYFVDGYGGGEVRWVYHGAKQKLLDIKVKQLPSPAGIEKCAVSQDRRTLYLLEETLGLWEYSAAVEKPADRRLVVFRDSVGELKGAAVQKYGVFVAETEASAISFFNYSNNRAPEQRWYLGEARKPASLAVLNQNASSLLAYVDDENASVYTLSISNFNNADITTAKVYPQVAAVAETDAVEQRGDAADDPAIWLNSKAPEHSRILGTNKKFGLLIYDLEGKLVQSMAVGDVNNVDVRQGLTWHAAAQDVAVASNRSDNTLHMFFIDEAGKVSDAGKVKTKMDDVYGICLYKHSQEKLYAFINDKDGRMDQYLIYSTKKGLKGKKVSSYKLASQPEGCVADDAGRQLFVGEEDVGVWHFELNKKGILVKNSATLIQDVKGPLVDDVEGLGLYLKDKERYLVVSSQGDHSYALFKADKPFSYVGSFRVGLNDELVIDGTSETDGLEVSSAFFNHKFPNGMIVIQDGHNLMPEQPQNFKIVPWESVANLIEK